MTGRLRDNRRRIRIPIALMAMLHLLLTTFCAVTHTHASLLPDPAGRKAHASASHAASISEASSNSLHCAYCEWLAASVAPASPPAPAPAVRYTTLLSVQRPRTEAALLAARLATRGPPSA